MRVTGGIYCRRRVECPPGDIRPSMDRMRESLFAVLGDLSGLSFLDLFSGSGIIGIEAASRGAAPVVLVERDRGKRRTILANIAFVESSISLVTAPVEGYLHASSTPFDLVFLDPPFAYEDKPALVRSVFQDGHVRESGVVLLHLPREEEMDPAPLGLEMADRRQYGRSLVQFFRRKGA